MAYKLIYIDDDPKEARSLSDGLGTMGLIEVKARKATNFESQLKELGNEFGKFDGVILDLKLDENQEDERRAHYTAPALAQQLKSNSVNDEGKITREFPIFLLTSKQKMARYYERDTESHDLFDAYYIKDSDFGSKAKEYEKEICSIIKAYSKIKKKSSYDEVLDKKLPDGMKYRIFDTLEENSSISAKSKFIYNKIIKQSGILIKESVLAARLGVDMDKSKGWSTLKEAIASEVKYTGVFSDFHQRWWAHSLIEWWRKQANEKPLASLDAEERTVYLNERMNLNLIAAEKLPYTRSSRFWTICQALERPLDPVDGFRAKTSPSESWLDQHYVSFEAYTRGEIEIRDIHPSEKERFAVMKKRFENGY